MRNRIIASPKHYAPALVVAALGAGVAVRGVHSAPGRTWPCLLLNGFYITSLAVSALFFLASQRLAGARWSAVLRRIPEALMSVLPAAAVLMLVLYFGRSWIFPWSVPGAFDHASAIAGKVGYLRVPFVFGRMALTLSVWVIFARLFRATSLRQDQAPGSSLACHYRLNQYAGGFVVVFAISFTSATYDWLVSLDTAWFSTMFAVYVFSGTFVQGIAAVTFATVLLRQRGYLANSVSEEQLHDLGKMLFAFSTFWAYIWVCQYLLIWYGNIPEEVTHYLKRTNESWLPLFLLNFTVNWVVPFAVLLTVRAKRNPGVLLLVSVMLLAGHWLDLYLLIMPSLRSVPELGIGEVAVAAGYLALFYLLALRTLAAAPLTPLHDPVLAAATRTHALHIASGADS